MILEEIKALITWLTHYSIKSKASPVRMEKVRDTNSYIITVLGYGNKPVSVDLFKIVQIRLPSKDVYGNIHIEYCMYGNSQVYISCLNSIARHIIIDQFI